MEFISLDDFDYFLPKEKIAQYPIPERDRSKLLVFDKNKNIKHLQFINLPDVIPEGSILIRNISKVIPARLFFKKPTGGRVEILLLEPILPSTDPQITLNSNCFCSWKTLVRGKNIKQNLELYPLNNEIENQHIVAIVKEKNPDYAIVEFYWNKNTDFASIITSLGRIPLPPYISRKDEEIDKIRYQTIYAKTPGSVASHTAGLHFTENIINALLKKSIDFVDVSLHIGLGTFKPIETRNVLEHKMHFEQFHVELDTLKKLSTFLNKSHSEQICIAVGTTSVRTLESLFWFANKVFSQKSKNLSLPVEIDQFIWRNLQTKLKPIEALDFLIELLERQNKQSLYGNTQLFILPTYEIQFFHALITNFHQPKSTLLLLISSFVGNEWKRIYTEALNNNYRFLSYGDSSILFKVRNK